jgi:hopanoid biosynthesis associated protein HpnK
MGCVNRLRRLVVNADDFGASGSINSAVIRAHREGILTSASLMVNGAAFHEAIELAKANPRLGVGLHLTLCCGQSTLPHSQIPALVERQGHFLDSAVLAGMKYFFSPSARKQLAEEIKAQFQKFQETGLTLDHVNGHLHFHLHPTVFHLLKECFQLFRVRAVRLTRDPLSVDWPLGSGRWGYRLSHALIFNLLARHTSTLLRHFEIAHSDYVFGLLENGRVTEEYICSLAKSLPVGDSELYSHPSLHEFKDEFEALVSPRVLAAIKSQNIELIRYQDLWSN